MSIISPIATNADGSARLTGSLQQLGKDDFLQLLVTKLQHQDPLDPMNDEDFVAQLAQFSSLEQMNNIANGIAESTQFDFLQTQSLNNVMASGFIGKEVKADYSSVIYDGESKPSIGYTLDEYAKDVTLTIKDGAGTVIRTLDAEDMGPGVHSFTWDGKNQQGNKVPEGEYYVEATATTFNGTNFSPELSLVGIVKTVFYRDGGAYLNVAGTEVALGDIQAIGEPGSFTDKD